MENKYQDCTAIELLKDESFLRWKLMASAKDHKFWEEFLLKYPEKKAVIDNASEMLQSLRMNDYSLSQQEKTDVFQSLEKEIMEKKKRQSFRLTFFRISAAASILILLGLSVFFFKSGKSPDFAFVNQTDSIFNDKKVQLILADNQVVAFNLNVDIRFDKNGVFVISNENQELMSSSIKTKNAKLNKLIVPKGKRSSLILADGTKIWMNSGSILEFPTAFNSDKREINLDGEIYIEVTKNEKQPFFVKAPDFLVEVLGTRFNVSAYKEDISHSVVLVEGKVEVQTTKNKAIELHPDEMFVAENNGVNVRKVDVYDYISWKDGLLQFRSEYLSQILNRLSRYYDVSIECDASVQNMRCSGKLVLFDDFDNVLKTIVNTIPVKYTKYKDKIKISKK